METTIIKSLKERFPETDFWLDSMLEKDIHYAVDNGFLGITTSPTITPRAMEEEHSYWEMMVRKQINQHPFANEAEILWECMYEVSAKRAKLLLPIYQEHGFDGRFCIQANVFDYMNADKMIAQSKRIHALGKNFIMKIPTTEAGLKAMEQVIAEGHSVMATATSTVSQVMAAAQAMQRGFDKRLQNHLPVDGIVMSCAMQLGLPEQCYRQYIKDNHIEIDEKALDYASIAVAKKAYILLRMHHPNIHFVLSNFVHTLHWSEFMGGKIMLTIPKRFVTSLENVETWENRIDIPVCDEYIQTLLKKIPFYHKAYDENALSAAQFTQYEGFTRTVNHFIMKYESALRNTRKVLLPDPYQSKNSSY